MYYLVVRVCCVCVCARVIYIHRYQCTIEHSMANDNNANNYIYRRKNVAGNFIETSHIGRAGINGRHC